MCVRRVRDRRLWHIACKLRRDRPIPAAAARMVSPSAGGCGRSGTARGVQPASELRRSSAAFAQARPGNSAWRADGRAGARSRRTAAARAVRNASKDLRGAATRRRPRSPSAWQRRRHRFVGSLEHLPPPPVGDPVTRDPGDDADGATGRACADGTDAPGGRLCTRSRYSEDRRVEGSVPRVERAVPPRLWAPPHGRAAVPTAIAEPARHEGPFDVKSESDILTLPAPVSTVGNEAPSSSPRG
jgi:hypothetical protein